MIPNFDPTAWLTVGNAAKAAGVHREWMRRLAMMGKVEAVQIDGLWFVRRDSAAAFERNEQGRGRPPAKPARRRRR
jgi:hypothetical protein